MADAFIEPQGSPSDVCCTEVLTTLCLHCARLGTFVQQLGLNTCESSYPTCPSYLHLSCLMLSSHTASEVLTGALGCFMA